MQHILTWSIRSILLLICGWLLISFLGNGKSLQPKNWFETSRDTITNFQEKTSNEFEEHLSDPSSIKLPELLEHTEE